MWNQSTAPPAPTTDLRSLLDEDVAEEQHAWEAPIQRSWDIVEEDEKGELKSIALVEQREKKKKLDHASGIVVEKGMIRYMYLILDFSQAMDAADLKPTRRQLMLDLLETFIRDFFDQNPISQLGVIISYEKRATKITELSGNPTQQIRNLRERGESGGELSLQNALQIAVGQLSQIPSYGSREILIIMGSLSTIDPGDIHDTINDCVRHRIRVNVIGLAAEVHVCTTMTSKTGGTYGVVIHRDHFKELLHSHIPPVSITKNHTSSTTRKWIRMGFPYQKLDPYQSLCACHQELRYGGLFCPKCKTKFCELPTECRVCGLTLVSSSHLARSYHHLFPIPDFKEVPTVEGEKWRTQCSSCLIPMDSDTHIRVTCTSCQQIYCIDCDVYIHQQLHNCPGCLASAQIQRKKNNTSSSTSTSTSTSASTSTSTSTSSSTTAMDASSTSTNVTGRKRHANGEAVS